MNPILPSSLALLGLTVSIVSAQTTVGTFTGADPGEGLDLQGSFPLALYAAASDAGPIVVGDATFLHTAKNTGGIVFAANETTFGVPTYGDPTPSVDDLNLRLVNDYVYFTGTGPGGVMEINLPVTVGQQYKLQLIYNEACCDRGFDVLFEGVLAADDFNPGRVQGGGGAGAPQDVGAVLTHTFTATDSVLNIGLDKLGAPFPDPNAIFDSATLEAVPEPSCAILVVASVVGLVAFRRPRV